MTILNNAIDSIQLGIEDYELIGENPKRLISCTRNLFSGILLLFKHLDCSQYLRHEIASF